MIVGSADRLEIQQSDVAAWMNLNSWTFSQNGRPNGRFNNQCSVNGLSLNLSLKNGLNATRRQFAQKTHTSMNWLVTAGLSMT